MAETNSRWRSSLIVGGKNQGDYYSLPRVEGDGLGPVSKLPVTIRILLESVVRHFDGQKITEKEVRQIASWNPKGDRKEEIPFVVSRILLQDFTGVPLLADLAAMRSAAVRRGKPGRVIEPLVPVDLVIDHSVQVDFYRAEDAFRKNMEKEFERNRSRYEFLKWGTRSFNNFRVIPPGIGICHQVNLEYLARVVDQRDGLCFPDTLVGTDSHTTMINGLGVLGWGVGGIEAEAGMLGQPLYFLSPDVIGVRLTGKLRAGVTATDLVLRITEMLRQARVVGKFVEFFGPGAAALSVPDRATIANMSPEYGATVGFFPIDEQTCLYLEGTGRSAEQIDRVRAYFQSQQMFGIPEDGIEYTSVLQLDLDAIEPAVSGPRRPQDRIPISELAGKFRELLTKSPQESGYGKKNEELRQRFPLSGLAPSRGRQVSGGGEQAPESVPVGRSGEQSAENTSTWTETEMINNRPTPTRIVVGHDAGPSSVDLGNGDIVIAAVTSCTNTSNPSVMLAAGLVAKKAVERGLAVPAYVKTSLAPGSRVVTEYLERSGLQKYLDALGFNLVGYGCTTCIGNSGPLNPSIEDAIGTHDLIVASVLSGNRNFEARIHQSVKANFLMSPPLVVAFALAGRVGIDLSGEPLGQDDQGRDVYLKDIWPSPDEIRDLLRQAFDPQVYRKLYGDLDAQNPLWDQISAGSGETYAWNPESNYVQEPPFFEAFEMEPGPSEAIANARALAIFGDSVTTDHISPAGAIKPSSPAGLYLQNVGVAVQDFNSYGARRGNHHVMNRGTFANVRIRNLMLPGVEGGFTMHLPDREQMSIYDAAMRYREEGVPLIVLAGQEYGTGSSRDWAAKGTLLLGVRAVVAQSFERIHRSNLVGMGVLPCQFKEGMSVQSLEIDGTENFDVEVPVDLKPRQEVPLTIAKASGETEQVPVILRIDTPVEVEYYRNGGILPYMLRNLLK